MQTEAEGSSVEVETPAAEVIPEVAPEVLETKPEKPKKEKVKKEKTVEAPKPEAKKPAKKEAPKKAEKSAPAKKAVTKPAKAKPAKASTPGQHGLERSKDLPWGPKKVAVIKALKALKAFNPMSAQSAKAIAEKAGLDAMMVRHYCYHAQAGGLVQVSQMEGVRGFSFSLTAKGAKVDPDAELKAASKK